MFPTNANLGRLGNSIAWWLGIEPYELFLYVFLPPLLLDAAVRIDFFLFKRVRPAAWKCIPPPCWCTCWSGGSFAVLSCFDSPTMQIRGLLNTEEAIVQARACYSFFMTGGLYTGNHAIGMFDGGC